VLLVAPRFARLREVAGVKAALRGVSAVVAGSLLGVVLTLAPPAIPGVAAGVIFAVAGAGLISGRVSPLQLIGAGVGASLLGEGVRALLG